MPVRPSIRGAAPDFAERIRGLPWSSKKPRGLGPWADIEGATRAIVGRRRPGARGTDAALIGRRRGKVPTGLESCGRRLAHRAGRDFGRAASRPADLPGRWDALKFGRDRIEIFIQAGKFGSKGDERFHRLRFGRRTGWRFGRAISNRSGSTCRGHGARLNPSSVVDEEKRGCGPAKVRGGASRGGR